MAHILITEARFYAHLNDMLLAGARGALEAASHSHETITVPGALELPGAIALAAESGRFDAFVEDEAQAIVRADPAQGNKGAGAAEAALALLECKGRFAS